MGEESKLTKCPLASEVGTMVPLWSKAIYGVSSWKKNIYWENHLFHLEINGCFRLSHLLATIRQVQCARPHTEYCADTISCNPHHHYPSEVCSFFILIFANREMEA